MTARRKSKLPDHCFKLAQKECRPVFRDSGGTVHEAASRLFYELAEQLFPPLDTKEFTDRATAGTNRLLPRLRQFYPTGVFFTLHAGPDDQYELMNRLFLAIAEAVENSHQSGIERGKSLLLQLAKGRITNQDFNKAALHGEDE